MIDELVKTRFWSKVEITDNCWIWKGENYVFYSHERFKIS